MSKEKNIEKGTGENNPELKNSDQSAATGNYQGTETDPQLQPEPGPQPSIMETHAHHLHKAPGKKWTHYLFEFLMLFLAVFCGFLAENFREHLVEKKRSRQYITSF